MKEERVCSMTPIMDFKRDFMESVSRGKAAVMMAVCALFITLMPADTFAASNLEETIRTAMEGIRTAIVHIAIPLYGLVAVICLIMIVASSGRKAEMAKDWLIRATIGAIAIGSIAVIMSFVENLDGLSF